MQPLGFHKIPVFLSVSQFKVFVLPHLSVNKRGPEVSIPLGHVFNYILKFLHTGCQWEMLPIEKGDDGKPEIHYTRVFRIFKRWCNDGSLVKAFINSVLYLDKYDKLDLSIIHGDGTTTAAKKGGDYIGFNGHKKMKGDKIIAMVDRNVNIICPFTVAAGNTSETILLDDAMSWLKKIFSLMNKNLKDIIMSLDSIYDSKKNRKKIFNNGMIPNVKENPRGRKKTKPGPKRIYEDEIFKERFRTVERAFAWEDKFKRLLLRFETISLHHFSLKLIAYTMINLRHFCKA